jgi:serine/threonine protein kinase
VTEDLLGRGAKLDRYKIREPIGQGEMGEVYRAWDGVLNCDVAVKVLTLRDEDMLRRFEREAKAYCWSNVVSWAWAKASSSQADSAPWHGLVAMCARFRRHRRVFRAALQ